MNEPHIKRVNAYIDGQNLFHSVKLAFGYTYPNYDIIALSDRVVSLRTGDGWRLNKVYFYTGIPSETTDYTWNQFWTKRLARMKTLGIETYARELSYNREKGIDLRLAIDAIRGARRNDYDVCIIFSQDQDFTELAKEIRLIAKENDRWIKIACAYPTSDDYVNKKGVYLTDWLPFDKDFYDTCIDPFDYRPKTEAP